MPFAFKFRKRAGILNFFTRFIAIFRVLHLQQVIIMIHEFFTIFTKIIIFNVETFISYPYNRRNSTIIAFSFMNNLRLVVLLFYMREVVNFFFHHVFNFFIKETRHFLLYFFLHFFFPFIQWLEAAIYFRTFVWFLVVKCTVMNG